MATAKINGLERPINDFTAAKAMEAGELISAIVQRGTGVFERIEAYSAERVESGSIKLTRAALFFRYPELAKRIPNEAWEASGNVFELPGPPPAFEEAVLAVFPDIVKLAREEVFQLLALVLVDDQELEDADKAGRDGIAALLAEKGRELRHRARMEEVVALASAAWEHAQQQLSADPTAQALVARLVSLRNQSREPSSAPASSTGSPTGTAGAAAKSSTRSRGRSSKPSRA